MEQVPSKYDSGKIYTVTEKDLKEADHFIKSLFEGGTKGTKKSRVMKATEHVHEPSGLTIYSWKVRDWSYKKGTAPINARGLFTRVTEGRKNEILIRGYNKFFNVNEVSETKVNIFFRFLVS